MLMLKQNKHFTTFIIKRMKLRQLQHPNLTYPNLTLEKNYTKLRSSKHKPPQATKNKPPRTKTPTMPLPRELPPDGYKGLAN